MLKRTKLLLTALCAVIACSLVAGSASAHRSIEIRGLPAEGKVQAEGRLRFIGTEREAGREVTCDITLLRTVVRLIPKIPGTLVGKLTGILIDRGETSRSPHCRNGSFVRLTHDIVPLECTHSELRNGILHWDCSRAPAGLWKLLYRGFRGTLPRITGIEFSIAGTQFNIRFLELFGGTIECLYRGESFGVVNITEATSVVSGAAAEERQTALERVRGSGLCPPRGTFEGTFTVRPTLTIALI